MPIPIREYYIRDYFVRDYYVAPKISLKKFEINKVIWYETFSNYLFSRCLILISFKHKILFKHHFRAKKNLVTASFNTKKSLLSSIYHREIYVISRNSLKRDDPEKYYLICSMDSSSFEDASWRLRSI
jgi:hypothetical protein